MTGCLYLFIRGLPVLIADTLVSPSVILRSDLALPSNLDARSDEHSPPTVHVARKLYLLGEKVATAWSGDAGIIRDTLATAAAMVPFWLSEERPMRRLGDIADDYAGKIQVIGVSATELIPPESGNRGQYHMNYLAPGLKENIKHLGEVTAIGSGQEYLIQKCREFSAHWERWPGNANPYEMAHSLVDAIRTDALRGEMFHRQQHSWGGFYEFAYFDDALGKWRRGHRSINAFGGIAKISDEAFTTIMIGRYILYDPGVTHGRIASVTFGKNGPAGVYETVLEDLLTPFPFEGQRLEKFWPGWQADTGCISIGARDGKFYNMTVGSRDVGKIKFVIDGSNIEVGVDSDLWDLASRAISKDTRLKYVPFRTLNIEDKALAEAGKYINGSR